MCHTKLIQKFTVKSVGPCSAFNAAYRALRFLKFMYLFIYYLEFNCGVCFASYTMWIVQRQQFPYKRTYSKRVSKA